MIHSLYSLTGKGWLKALSFILATAMFVMILLNADIFAVHFGGKTLYRAVFTFYGMAILWIHGVGFEIQSALWRTVFLPLAGYFLVVSAFIYLLSFK